MRHSRSRWAGDLKAGNITLLLDWTTTSTRLMLPHSAQGLGFMRYVLELLNLFRGMCELEVRLAAMVSLLHGIELDLQMFKLDAEVSKFGVKVTIVVYFVGESPVVMDDQGIVQ